MLDVHNTSGAKWFDPRNRSYNLLPSMPSQGGLQQKV